MSKKRRTAKAAHLFKDMEVLVEMRDPKELPKDLHPAVRGIIKAYENIIRSLLDVHEDYRIVYSPYGAPDYTTDIGTSYGIEIGIHKCCGLSESHLRLLNKISNFDSGEWPVTDVSIEACDLPAHQKFSKRLGETFTCTKVTIETDFSDWRKLK